MQSDLDAMLARAQAATARDRHDAAFIAAARTDVPALAADVEALVEWGREIQAAVKECWESGVHIDIEREELDYEDQEATYEAFGVGLYEWNHLHGLSQAQPAASPAAQTGERT